MHVFCSSHSVKFLKLLLFDVVVSGGDSDDDDNSNQNGCSFQPSLSKTFGQDTQNKRNSSGSAKNSQHFILKVLDDLNEESFTSSQMVLGGLTIG